jgi:transposase
MDALKKEQSSLEVAARFDVVQRAGEIAAGKAGGETDSQKGRNEQRLRQLIERYPDVTLEVSCDLLEEKTGVAVSETTMWRQLRRMGLTPKKVPPRVGEKPPGRDRAARRVSATYAPVASRQARDPG